MCLSPETLSKLPPPVAWGNAPDSSELCSDLGESLLHPALTGFELGACHQTVACFARLAPRTLCSRASDAARARSTAER